MSTAGGETNVSRNAITFPLGHIDCREPVITDSYDLSIFIPTLQVPTSTILRFMRQGDERADIV